jgi:hypothetical protein
LATILTLLLLFSRNRTDTDDDDFEEGDNRFFCARLLLKLETFVANAADDDDEHDGVLEANIRCC